MTTAQFLEIMMMLWLVVLVSVDDVFLATGALVFTLAYGIGSIMAARKNK